MSSASVISTANSSEKRGECTSIKSSFNVLCATPKGGRGAFQTAAHLPSQKTGFSFSVKMSILCYHFLKVIKIGIFDIAMSIPVSLQFLSRKYCKPITVCRHHLASFVGIKQCCIAAKAYAMGKLFEIKFNISRRGQFSETYLIVNISNPQPHQRPYRNITMFISFWKKFISILRLWVS